MMHRSWAHMRAHGHAILVHRMLGAARLAIELIE